MEEISTSDRLSKAVEEDMPTITLTTASAHQHTPDLNSAAMKIERARDVYMSYAGLQDKPTKGEILAWYFYELCSYSVHTVLIPMVFPLIISQVVSSPLDTSDGWIMNDYGMACKQKEVLLYQGLTNRLIHIQKINLSALEWTSISWVTGLILGFAVLGSISIHLDHGKKHPLIGILSIAIGALFCLPAGFFNTIWIFPPYIAAIVAAHTVASASHIRHLGLMIRGYTGHMFHKNQFLYRKGVSGWLSLYATAFGCLGSAIMSAFTYRMLKFNEKINSLWIVSIFSGLKWLAGVVHIVLNRRLNSSTNGANLQTKRAQVLSIFKYPHAVGSLVAVFLSSFTTMSIFTGGTLHLVGNVCFKPVYMLFLYLIYFIFPMFSLPLSHPLQHVIKADAVKMQLLGFLISVFTSGFGFYFRKNDWNANQVFLFAAIQSTSTGLLYAFGRVLTLDCAPHGKEGVFSMWVSWIRAFGGCVGFTFASIIPGNISACLGVAFCSSIVGVLVLSFGTMSSFGGAVAAGHIREVSQKGSPVHGLDSGVIMKEASLEGRLESVEAAC